MDYLSMLLVLAFLGLCIYGVTRWEARDKLRYKRKAYKLLEAVDPDAKEVGNVIKCLRLYGGRWRKDKECVELVRRLQEKLPGL